MKTKTKLGILSLFCTASAAVAAVNVSGNNTVSFDGTESGTFSVYQGAAGDEAVLQMTGGIAVNMSGDSRVGAGSSAGQGSATFSISGDGNTFALGTPTAGNGSLYLGDQMASGSAQILIGGSNNSFYVGSYVQGATLGSNASTLLSITGSNNSFNYTSFRTHFRVGWNGTSSGSNSVYMKGDGSLAAQKVYMNMAAVGNGTAVDIGGAASNAATNSFVMDGNAVLRGDAADSKRVDLYVNSVQSSGAKALGASLFAVKGSGNEVKLNAVVVGNTSQATGSTATFRVSGTGSSIQLNSLAIVGSGGTSSDIKGGILEFVVTASSISTVEAKSVTGFDGILVLDLSGFVDFGIHEYELISANNDWSAAWNAFGWDNDTHSASSDRIIVKGADASKITFNYDSGTLTATYMNEIPEPGAYAAIFGALALAFAAYRRRK